MLSQRLQYVKIINNHISFLLAFTLIVAVREEHENYTKKKGTERKERQARKYNETKNKQENPTLSEQLQKDCKRTYILIFFSRDTKLQSNNRQRLLN